MIHTNQQIEKRRLQQYEKEAEPPNEQSVLDRIAKMEKVAKEFAKQLRGVTSLIDNPDVTNKRSGFNNFQIGSLLQSTKIMMMRLASFEEKNEMRVPKLWNRKKETRGYKLN